MSLGGRKLMFLFKGALSQGCIQVSGFALKFLESKLQVKKKLKD